jgi:cell division protein FtsB
MMVKEGDEMNSKERCRMLIDEARMLRDENIEFKNEIERLRNENAKLLEDEFEIRKTCIIFDKENAELKKELNEVGRKWLNDFSRQDTQITELNAQWETLRRRITSKRKAYKSIRDDISANAFDYVLRDIKELEKKAMK